MDVPRGFLRQQLYERPRQWLMSDLAFPSVISAGFLIVALVVLRNLGASSGVLWLTGGAAAGVVLAAVAAYAARRWPPLGDHPDLAALGRYGAPGDVIAAIEAELADAAGVLRLTRLSDHVTAGRGVPRRPVRGDLLLTRSWLLYFPVGTDWRLTALSLREVVWVYRSEMQPRLGDLLLNPTPAVVTVDRHGVRCEISGNDAGLTRVLAELLTRVPWALNRFDAETARQWEQEREQVVAIVERRRDAATRSATQLPP
jgi:hypothetical protein